MPKSDPLFNDKQAVAKECHVQLGRKRDFCLGGYFHDCHFAAHTWIATYGEKEPELIWCALIQQVVKDDCPLCDNHDFSKKLLEVI